METVLKSIYGSTMLGIREKGSDLDTIQIDKETVFEGLNKQYIGLDIGCERMSLTYFLWQVINGSVIHLEILNTPDKYIIKSSEIWDKIQETKFDLVSGVSFEDICKIEKSPMFVELEAIESLLNNLKSGYYFEDCVDQKVTYYSDDLGLLILGNKPFYVGTKDLTNTIKIVQDILRDLKKTLSSEDTSIRGKNKNRALILRSYSYWDQMINTGEVDFSENRDIIWKAKRGELTDLEFFRYKKELKNKLENSFFKLASDEDKEETLRKVLHETNKT